MAIIEVINVTKEYRLGQIKSLGRNLVHAFDRIRGRNIEKQPPFKALDSVNFEVKEGEVLGIIGHNGAGKSTLLKILSRITVPTRGNVKISGSVAPLIEVGAGLVGDLTGRENIYLNATILGLPRSAIKRKLDEIVAFAELEEFIDTPVKRYSSGMLVRLGFSIATSIDADILIVDEVLAVGDLPFQRKCFEKLERMIMSQERTVLLVSHHIRQVERICSRVILLDRGSILSDGAPSDVCKLYYQRSNERVHSYFLEQQSTRASIQTTGEVELLNIDILDVNGRSIIEIESGETLRVQIRFHLKVPLQRPEIVVGTHTIDFVYLCSGSTAIFNNRPDYLTGTHEIEYTIPFFPLVAGVYCIRMAIYDKHRRCVFVGENLKTFSVTTTGDELNEPSLRTLILPTEWRLNGKRYAFKTSKNAVQEPNN